MAKKRIKINLGQRATRLTAVVATSVIVDKGLTLLNNTEFMQSPDKVNIKILASNGGALLIGAAVGMAVPNDTIEHVGYGMAAAGANNTVDQIVDMVKTKGVSGLGAAGEEFLDIYDTDDDLNGMEPEDIPLAGGEGIKLA